MQEISSESDGNSNNHSQETLPQSHRNVGAKDNVMAGNSPVTYGRRDCTLWEERGLVHRILDIPYGLRYFFGPVPTYSLTEVRRRVCTMWSINEPQLSEMVNQKLLSHLTAIYDRRRDNKYAFIEPLKRDWKTYVNGSDCLQACSVEIWPKRKGIVVFDCYADDKAGVDDRYPGPPSEDATKSFCTTLIAFADYLNASGSCAETLLFKCDGRFLGIKGGTERGLWWSNKVAHQFGLRSGEMKIKLRD